MKDDRQNVHQLANTQPVPPAGARASTPSETRADPPGVPTNRLRACVQLRDTDACSLRRQCAQTGMTAARYVATLLAAVEEGRAQIAGKDAVEALAQSNYQLSWLGRNVRALLRNFEASVPQQHGTAETLPLRELIESLKTHLLRASIVLADIEATRHPRRCGGCTPRARRTRRGK